MPYTPPSHQSPVSSRTTSPVISRSPSFSAETSTGIRSPASPRPSLPRSVSSTTYLNKQRRGPSITQQHQHQESSGLPQSPVDDDSSAVRQVESGMSNNGAILSPPDSSENSDGEDVTAAPRGRNSFHAWGALEQAVRSIELKREGSPARNGVSFSEPTTTIHSPTALSAAAHKMSPTALSAAARRISHSRSSTDTAILIPDRVVTESPTDDSEDDDDEDDLRVKPPLVRKKSGELVKPALRPSSRRRYSSMPGTPTYSKSVHFNDNGNQTRHFLQVEKPSAISAGSSPVDTYDEETEYPFEPKETQTKVEWNLRLANFPEDTYERKSLPVRVEKVYLSPDTKTLIGTVAVANISFQKHVAARFTLDYWKTTSEVMAEFESDIRQQNLSDGYDRFTFNIRLSDQANLENKTLLLCVRYNSGGQEHWDSNNGMNYQIDFVKKLAKSASTSSLSSLSGSPRQSRSTIPRSRHSPPAASSRQERSLFADEDLPSKSSAYHFGSPERLTGDPTAQPQVKLKPRSKRVDLSRSGSAPAVNGLGGRYDFGASLSAALSSAQDKLGKQSGLLPHAQPSAQANAHYFSPKTVSEAKPVVPERPDAITTDRPAIGSQQYKDLVNKFCYFTPGSSGKSSPSPQTSAGSKPSSTDGSSDGASPSESSPQSGSATPHSLSPFLDGANDRLSSRNDISKLISRSGSPASISSSNNYVARTYSYPYARDGYLSETHTPTAIRG